MSAATPIPPVPLPAPQRSPYRYLWSDPWIAISLLLLIGTGMNSALTRLQSSTPTSVPDLMGSFLGTGYFFWSAYFGLAACWRFGIGRLWGMASRWIGGSLFSMVFFAWMLLTLGLVYAVCGGGIYHFARRWWLLAHGQQPPFLRHY